MYILRWRRLKASISISGAIMDEYDLNTVQFEIQNSYGVKMSPFTMKDPSCSTLHSPNYNGGGAKPEFRMLSRSYKYTC
ncbi:hypothetical protein AC625_19260 [Peribacillus loiseleuriae]|uniref:Uncharacterized protein n=1 Tax=Peribacillus loiseleuriae TaxID=1679170 RepID=A0A0K9GXS3_9BACI|nr:hypothetical protein AC625_19260 [Peribacillus loiseleuriae]